MGLVGATSFEHDKLLVRQSIGRRGQGIISCFVVRYVSGTILVVDVALQEVTAAIEGCCRRSSVCGLGSEETEFIHRLDADVHPV